jgi:outer membrane translocation and assembly module TamA
MSFGKIAKAMTAVDSYIEVRVTRTKEGFKAVYIPVLKSDAAKDNDEVAAPLIAALSKPFKIEAETADELNDKLEEFLAGVGEARAEASDALTEYMDQIASAANATKAAASKKASGGKKAKADDKKVTSAEETPEKGKSGKASDEGFDAKSGGSDNGTPSLF